MITVDDLDSAIAECMGQKNPNANTCMKLASYLTIKKSMTEPEAERIPQRSYSFAAAETEFEKKISAMPFEQVVKLFSEVMETLQVINPAFHSAIMRKL